MKTLASFSSRSLKKASMCSHFPVMTLFCLYLITLKMGLFNAITGSFFVSAQPSCTGKNDCVSANTYKYDLVYANTSCMCVCLPGWTGDKCQTAMKIPKVNISNLNYESEYWSTCKYSKNYSQSVQTCEAFGNGWYMASVPTYESAQAINYITKDIFGSSYQGTHVGGGTADLNTWKWMYGRLKGTMFYMEWTHKCYNNLYCGWGAHEPDNFQCVHAHLYQTVIRLLGTEFDDFQPYPLYCHGTLSYPDCFACERSLCNNLLDCGISPGFNASGYYPNCACNCKVNWHGEKCDNLTCVINDCVARFTYKFAAAMDGKGCMCVCFPGWTGDRCQIYYDIPSVTIANRNYVSEYWSTCRYATSYDMGVQTCRAFGNGWDMATAPTEDSAKTVSAHTSSIFGSSSNDGAIVGGETADFNTWKWKFGRIKDKAFFTKNPNWHCLNNLYCIWAYANPDNFSCDGSEGQTVLRITDSTFDDVQDKPISCKSGLQNWFPSCFACERSPCNILLDCDPNITTNVTGYYPNCICKNRACTITKDCNVNTSYSVSGIYPNCVCNCSHGYRGKRCDTVFTKSITVVFPTIPFVTDPFLNPNGSNSLFGDSAHVSSNRVYFLFALCMIAFLCLIVLIVFFAFTCYKRQKAKKMPVNVNQDKSRFYRCESRQKDANNEELDDESDMSSASAFSKGMESNGTGKNTFFDPIQNSLPSSRSDALDGISTPKSPNSLVEDRNWNVDGYFKDLIFSDFIRTDNDVLTSKQTNVTNTVLVKNNTFETIHSQAENL